MDYFEVIDYIYRIVIDKQQVTPLDRLAYMGKRGMGALEFKPARTPAIASNTAIKLSRLVESARQAVHGELGSDGSPTF